jgi:glutathione peroxidase
MNALAEKYGDKLNILAFPCNQFGHQTNEGDDEFMNTLKYVRPGNNFELNPAITVLAKGDVNGANQQPLFKWMKSEIMIPTGGDDESCLVDTNDNGCGDADALVLPRGGFGGTTLTLWSPVARSDIAWNFEKFLLDKDGNMVQRYHRYFLVGDIAKDIDALM